MEGPDDELAVCLRVLAQLRAAPVDDPDRCRLERAVAGFVKDGKRSRRAVRDRAARIADAAVLAATATGRPDRVGDLSAEPPGGGDSAGPGSLRRDRRCYVCKRPYRRVDHRYHWLCPDCAIENVTRRVARADLTGRWALLTGGRVKIGYHLALKLLHDGAAVTVTTRFPRDAARRFAAAPDAAAWWSRLDVVGADLRDPRQVLALCDQVRDRGRPLDILVNNAAQTVRRPAWAYRPLVVAEAAELPVLPGPPPITLVAGFRPGVPVPGWATALAHRSQPRAAILPDEAGVSHPRSEPDGAGCPLPADVEIATGLLTDPAPVNSWSARVGDVDPVELVETQLVNAVAPFLLLNGLRPVLAASPHPRRYVVNVSAVEGWFAARCKTAGHPHTNMAKAALNMLTRTAAAELAAEGIYLSSVDTGWITDEKPAPRKERAAAAGWRPPLDVVDGAARVYDPIVRGEAGTPVSGVLLKDYREVPW